jgi:hypothetical protein
MSTLEAIARAGDEALDSDARHAGSLDLYEILVNRARTLGFDDSGFEARSYQDAQDDFDRKIREAIPDDPSVVIAALQEHVITPDSYRRMSESLAAYWHSNRLEDELRAGSLAVITNHHYFTDLFLLPAVIRDLRQGFDPYAARRNVLVLSRLMATREIDLENDGNRIPVPIAISFVARQLHTVQELPDGAPRAATALRESWNDATKAMWATIASDAGNILYLAGGGGPDAEVDSPGGRQLLIKPVNHEAARLLSNADADRAPDEPPRRITVIGLFVSCPFGRLKACPSEATFAFTEPRRPHSRREIDDLMHEIAAAGAPLVREQFPGGVFYVSDREAFATRTAAPQRPVAIP